MMSNSEASGDDPLAEARADADKCREVAAVTVKALAQLQAAIAELADRAARNVDDNANDDTPYERGYVDAIGWAVYEIRTILSALSDSTALDRALDKAREQGAAAEREAVGLLNDLVTAKKLRLDAEEWQLVWDRVFAFLARGATS